VQFGAKIGWNYNYAKSEFDYKNDQSLSGWHAGLYARVTLAKKLYLTPEFQFSARNYSLELFSHDFHFGYIEVPLLLSWTPAKWISLEAGPNVAFKISSNEFPLEDAFDKNVDLGFVAGPRVNITNNLSVVARYWVSTVPFVDYDFYDATGMHLGKLKVYNRSVEISLAWTYNPIRKAGTKS
jgi:hypothetical protein